MKYTYIIIGILLLFSISAPAQVSVIANKSVSDNSIKLSEAGNIYSLAQTTWSDGAKIVVFDNAGDAKNSFYSAIDKDIMSLKKEWMKKQLTGAAKAPQSVSSDEDMVKKISETPGAIGFVKQAASLNGNVKVLLQVK